MRIFVWLVRAFIFITLFAFALNNQQPASVFWFFGFEWRAPMVIVLLLSFVGGAALGVLAMLPPLMRARRTARGEPAPDSAELAGGRAGRARRSEPTPAADPVSVAPLSQPPREAL